MLVSKWLSNAIRVRACACLHCNRGRRESECCWLKIETGHQPHPLKIDGVKGTKEFTPEKRSSPADLNPRPKHPTSAGSQ